MLILLDNARDTTQVRPLLPGTPGCLVLVTSRAPLTGLGATDGAHLITLDLLDVGEARDLLAARLGRDRVAAEPDAVDEIIARCARLPLALAIVAARAGAQPNLSLRSLAEALRDARHRLNTLSTDDPATDVRAALSWSYRTLTPTAARLFRLLSHHPGADIGNTAAASLAALSVADIRRPLAELAHAQLLTERDPGRYGLHDLLREYAAELCHGTDAAEHDLDATGRVMDHYLHTGYAAALLLEPTRQPIVLDPPRDGVTVAQLADHDRARAWFATEYPTLLAAIDAATRAHLDSYVWQTVWTRTQFLDRKGLWRDRITLAQAALAATRRLADPDAQAWAHFSLGVAYLRVSRLADAQAQLNDSLELYRRAGDLVGQARVAMPLSYAAHRQGDHALAVRHARRGLQRYRAVGDRAMQGRCLSNLAWLYTHLGDYRQALVAGREAGDISRDLHDRQGLANARDTLGLVHHKLGHHDLAIDSYRQALDLYKDLGLRYHEAETLTRVGDTYQALGDAEAAGDAWRTVLAIFVELDHPDADQIRDKLTGLGPAANDRRRT